MSLTRELCAVSLFVCIYCIQDGNLCLEANLIVLEAIVGMLENAKVKLTATRRATVFLRYKLTSIGAKDVADGLVELKPSKLFDHVCWRY